MTIGERIKQRRKELGLTIDEVSVKLNKNRATVYRYENNDIGNLPLTVLEPLARVLSTTPSYLMGWEENVSEDEYQAYKTLLKKIGIDYSYIAFFEEVDHYEREFYLLRYNGKMYRISLEENNKIKADIESFIKFKFTELLNEEHISYSKK